MEKITPTLEMNIHGRLKTLKVLNAKSKLIHSFGYGKNAEYAEAIFEYALILIKKNIGKGITQSEYDEFIENGSLLSFWYQGVCYEYKNSKVKVYDDFSALND